MSRLREFLEARHPWPPPREVPDYHPDRPPHRSSAAGGARQPTDLLGIGPEVDAFAYLISLKSMAPPLAIGLFGAWGSGKSFFIRSLQQRVDRLLADGAAAPSGTVLPFYRSVVQIEFNAWQYMQGDLWASLLDHLLRNLDGDALEADDLVGARQREYVTKMQITNSELRSEQQTLRVLEDERRVALAAVEEKRAARAVAVVELEQAKRAHPVALAALSDPVRGELAKLATRAGVPDVMTRAQDVGQAVQEIRATVARGGGVVTGLRRAGWRYTTVLVATVIGAPIAAGWLAATHSWSAVTQASALVASMLVVAVGVLKGANRSLAGLIDEIATVEAHATKEVDDAVRAAEHQLTAIEAQEAVAREQERRLAGKAAELAAKLAGVTPGRVLDEFLAERLGSDDYRKYLGLPAVVRRDLDRLSRLIERENQADDDPFEGTEATKRRVNRIVLYIDDLDRCPTPVVIQVLQAVHLLLAFPLFVVVVAVDSRWLAGSLEEYYAAQLRRSNDDGTSASANDYLEKIFQVPFWVSPLGADERRLIVQGLVGAGAEAPSRSGGGAAQADVDDETPAQQQLAALLTRMSDVDDAAAPWLDAARMQITVEEMAFMNDLAPLLGDTPRSVKRFVNVYQLIKSIARARGPYTNDDARNVLFLLALATGRPAEAHTLAGAAGSDLTIGELVEQSVGTAHAMQSTARDPLLDWLATHDSWSSVPMAQLAPWLEPVQRFSFKI